MNKITLYPNYGPGSLALQAIVIVLIFACTNVHIYPNFQGIVGGGVGGGGVNLSLQSYIVLL